jgi:hypothetical protein
MHRCDGGDALRNRAAPCNKELIYLHAPLPINIGLWDNITLLTLFDSWGARGQAHWSLPPYNLSEASYHPRGGIVAAVSLPPPHIVECGGLKEGLSEALPHHDHNRMAIEPQYPPPSQFPFCGGSEEGLSSHLSPQFHIPVTLDTE